MGVRAIDVSVHQGVIDWRAVAASGVRAAWIKVGGADGGYYHDSRADANLAGAQAAGITFGTYYFCAARVGNAVEQARHAVSCGHGTGVLWPAADLENNPFSLSREQLDVWLGEFCAEVMHLTGRESLWYGNVNVGVGYTTRAPGCPIWIANYGRVDTPGITPPAWTPAVPPHWSTYDVWQFNSETRIPGVSANTVDQNVITDAFWARMTSSTTPAHQEDDMINWRPVHCPEHGDAQWLLTFDGAGRPRRLFLGPGDPQLYWGLGWIQTVEALVFTGDQAAKFMAIPEALPDAPLDPAAIVAGVRQPLTDAVTAALQGLHVDVDEHAVAEAVLTGLHDRLAG